MAKWCLLRLLAQMDRDTELWQVFLAISQLMYLFVVVLVVEPKQLLANRGLSFVQEHQVMLMMQLRHTLRASLLTQE